MQNQSTSVAEACRQAQSFLKAGDFSRALSIFRAVLEVDASNTQASAGAGIALLMLEKFNEAVSFLESAAKTAPQDPAILEALGVVYVHSGRSIEAETVLRKSLRFGRNNPETLANLASALNENGKFDEAESMLKSCLRRVPDHLQAQHNLALLQLLKGDLEAGWPGFELRNQAAGRGLPSWAKPCDAKLWQGEDIQGSSIVLFAEQGLGDTIQFARYAPLLSQRGVRVVLQCQPALMDLLSSIEGVDHCVSTDEIVTDVDYKASVLSMPALMNTRADTIPASIPYIGVSEDKAAHWSEIISGLTDKPTVGLVWAGNPDNKTDHKRSMDLVELSPLMHRDDCKIISFQVGAAAEQLNNDFHGTKPYVLFPEIQPLPDVAAALRNIDLLITVDTALAHLAGAVGAPVWTMITHFPDWRWMLNRQDTPWYPSMTLFRQPSAGDWGSVVQSVTKALDQKFN